MACKGCLMMLYCGRDCQKAHWSQHKIDCRSGWMQKGWRPGWEREGRVPAFVNNEPEPYQGIGPKKYLWGNVPAIDIVALGRNEGKGFSKPLKLLFAASGDVRNVIKSVGEMPESFNAPLEVVINDHDFDIVARNAILLLISLLLDDPVEAAECAVSVWYSTLLTRACMEVLKSKVRPLIESVCGKLSGKPTGVLQGKTWVFADRSVRLILTKEKWDRLLSFCDVPDGLGRDGAQKVRATVMRARQDHVDRDLFGKPPNWRMGSVRFREDGILLPFGHPRAGYEHPNPTFFQTKDQWPMKDSADPMEGWPLASVLQATEVGAAKDDLYGKLFYHVRNVFAQFHRRLSCLKASFTFYELDARDLPRHLAEDTFDRIEVSNICDGWALGIGPTLALGASLLRSPAENRHAALIMLFMNAVHEAHQLDELNPVAMAEELKAVQKFLPRLSPRGMADADMIRLINLMPLVRDGEKYFNIYMEREKFDKLGALVGMKMKAVNTIIDPWPMKLKKTKFPEAQEEFDLLAASGWSGVERYVEWSQLEVS